MKFFAVVLACLLQGALSQVTRDRPCAEIAPLANFNNDIINGVFYWPQIYPWQDVENVDCLYAFYNNTPTAFTTVVGGVSNNDEILFPYASTIEAPGVFGYEIDDRHLNVIAISSDSQTYGSFFACANTEEGSVEYAWILTKERNPSQEIIDTARAGYAAKGISVDELITINQANCPAPIS